MAIRKEGRLPDGNGLDGMTPPIGYPTATYLTRHHHQRPDPQPRVPMGVLCWFVCLLASWLVNIIKGRVSGTRDDDKKGEGSCLRGRSFLNPFCFLLQRLLPSPLFFFALSIFVQRSHV